MRRAPTPHSQKFATLLHQRQQPSVPDSTGFIVFCVFAPAHNLRHLFARLVYFVISETGRVRYSPRA